MASDPTKNDAFDLSKIESGSDIRSQISLLKKDLNLLEKKRRGKESDKNIDIDSELRSKYSDFEQRYSTLFTKIIHREMEDDVMLNHMLDMLDRVKSGNMSEFNASANVGKKLYDAHVAPNIDTSLEKMALKVINHQQGFIIFILIIFSIKSCKSLSYRFLAS